MTEVPEQPRRKRSPYLVWGIAFVAVLLLPLLAYFALVQRVTAPYRAPEGPPPSPLHPITSVAVSSVKTGEAMPNRCILDKDFIPPKAPPMADSPQYKFIYAGYVEGFSWDTERNELEPGVAFLVYDGNLFACDAARSVIWRTDLRGEAQSLALSPENGVYVLVSSQDRKTAELRRYGPSGHLLWNTPSQGEIRAVAGDGTVYLQQHQGTLRAYTSNGTFAWVSEPTTSDIFGPAIGPDGALYLTDYHALYAVSPQGIVLWQQAIGPLDQQIHSAPSVAADGTIYFGGSTLFAIRPNGAIKWKFTPPARNAYPEDRSTYIRHTPMIARDGSLFFDTYDGQVYAMTPDGQLLWYYACDEKFCGFDSFQVWRGGSLAASDDLNGRWLIFTPGMTGGLMRHAWPAEFHDRGHSRLAELP
jgi:outer membrane protein assembly factor BamB